MYSLTNTIAMPVIANLESHSGTNPVTQQQIVTANLQKNV